MKPTRGYSSPGCHSIFATTRPTCPRRLYPRPRITRQLLPVIPPPCGVRTLPPTYPPRVLANRSPEEAFSVGWRIRGAARRPYCAREAPATRASLFRWALTEGGIGRTPPSPTRPRDLDKV